MKQLLLLFVLSISIAFLSFDTAPFKRTELSKAPKKAIEPIDTSGLVFSLDSNKFDFGDIDNYNWATLFFYAKNTSNHPIVIDRLATSCGCDYAEGPRKPILPGETVPLKYCYDSHRIGISFKTIYVSYNGQHTILKIALNVRNTFKHSGNYDNAPGYAVEKPFGLNSFVK